MCFSYNNLSDTFYSTARDLLCIVVYGFRSFCTDFLTCHPKHFVSPLRVSESAVETLFKFAAGGKLDASNYATSRAACLVQRAVSSGHTAVPDIGMLLSTLLFLI